MSVLPEGMKPPVLPIGMMPQMPFVHPSFGARPELYMSSIALIPRPDDVLSSPLRQHILDYEPPRGFFIPAFAMFDGSDDPYDHILHYNQMMILNANNDHLLFKVFSASLWGACVSLVLKGPT